MWWKSFFSFCQDRDRLGKFFFDIPPSARYPVYDLEIETLTAMSVDDFLGNFVRLKIETIMQNVYIYAEDSCNPCFRILNFNKDSTWFFHQRSRPSASRQIWPHWCAFLRQIRSCVPTQGLFVLRGPLLWVSSGSTGRNAINDFCRE